MRQLADANAAVTLARSYEPLGTTLASSGAGETTWQFTGEARDASGLTYLRARYLSTGTGRFVSRDTWPGSYIKLPTPTGGYGSNTSRFVAEDWRDYTRPLTLNGWAYVEGDPINRVDPSGHCGIVANEGDPEDRCWQALHALENEFPFIDLETDVSWYAGNIWRIDELRIVRSDLETLDRAMTGIRLSEIFAAKEVRIRRVRRSGDCGLTTPWTISLYDPTFTDPSCMVGTLGHELAHKWDYKANLSQPFERYVGASTVLIWYSTGPESPPIYGSGAPTNRMEDFAESLTEYVYDDLLEGIIPGEKRWRFIETLLTTGEVLVAFPYPVPIPTPPKCSPQPP